MFGYQFHCSLLFSLLNKFYKPLACSQPNDVTACVSGPVRLFFFLVMLCSDRNDGKKKPDMRPMFFLNMESIS